MARRSRILTRELCQSMFIPPSKNGLLRKKWPPRQTSTLASPIFGVQTHEMHSLVPTSTSRGVDSLSSQFTGLSVCHPIYYDHTMKLSLRHAIYSATLSTQATATFMFLQSWSGSMHDHMITNPWGTSSLLMAYPRDEIKFFNRSCAWPLIFNRISTAVEINRFNRTSIEARKFWRPLILFTWNNSNEIACAFSQSWRDSLTPGLLESPYHSSLEYNCAASTKLAQSCMAAKSCLRHPWSKLAPQQHC